MLESLDLSMAIASFLRENQDPKRIIWIRGYNLPNLENHITTLGRRPNC